MARICIVTPGQLGSNPRVVKEASALVAAGHNVHVVSTKVVAFVEPRDQAIMSTAPFAITRVDFDAPLAWRVERLRQTAARFTWHLGRVMPVAAYAYSAMTRRLTEAASAIAADLYIAHYVAALPAAARAARQHGAFFAFDAEDFHLGDLPDTQEHALEKGLIRSLEAAFLPQAAYVTAASPGIADAYAGTYGIKRPTVVLNAFPRSEATTSATPRGSAVPGPTLYWFSQTIGPGRGLECAVEAIALAASRPHLHLRGTPANGYEAALHALAVKCGVADRLHLHPPEAPHVMSALAAEHDVGLVLEAGETLNRRIALTNKQFTYLLAGIPVVMSDVPAHVAFAGEAEGAAIVYAAGDPPALASAIDEVLCVPSKLAMMRRAALDLGIGRFCWEEEAPKLRACVDALLS